MQTRSWHSLVSSNPTDVRTTEKTLNLYNDGKWSRNFRNVQGKMTNTSFNIAGFIQPYYVVELLHRDDHDSFNVRQLFDVPLLEKLKSITEILKLNCPLIFPRLRMSSYVSSIYTSHQRPTFLVKTL